MGLRNYGAAINAAVFSTIALAASTTAGKADEIIACPQPIAHCTREVGARCEKESNGKIVIIYRDKSFYSSTFTECMNKALAKLRQPNQQRPSQQKPTQNR